MQFGGKENYIFQEANEIWSFLIILHYYHFCVNEKPKFAYQTAEEAVSQM